MPAGNVGLALEGVVNGVRSMLLVTNSDPWTANLTGGHRQCGEARGAAARLNFDPETGKRIWGMRLDVKETHRRHPRG